MKHSRLVLVLAALLVLAMGCKENSLSWTDESVCLNYEGQATCEKAQHAGYLVRLVDGKPQMKVLPLEGLPAKARFSQFGEGKAATGKSLALGVDGGKLVLSDGSTRFVDESGSGLLLWRGPDGATSIAMAEAADVANRAAFIDLSKIRGTIELGVKDFGPSMLMMQTINLVIEDDETHYIPNDTGVGVIITDNFKVSGNCDAAMPDQCCANADPDAAPIEWEQLVQSYADSSYRLLKCFPLGSICTFVSGTKLIVKDCIGDSRYCLDLTACKVRIETTDGHGICISVPSTCTMANPFH